MKKFLVAMALLPLATLAAVRPMTVAELTAGAQAVAAVEVVSWSGRVMTTPAGDFPFILFRCRTLRSLDGRVPAEFEVRAPGQVVDGKPVIAVDSPPLAVGHRFVLFINPAVGTTPAEAVYEVVGFSEGALPMFETGSGREPVVVLPAAEGEPGRRVRARLVDVGSTVKAVRANRGGRP